MITENINWDFVADSILKQKTILFVGHGLTIAHEDEKNENGKEAGFLRSIVDEHPADILSYHDKDGFLVFKNQEAKLLLMNKIGRFYEKDFSNESLEKLAEIPFHLIITVTPDLTLNKIFERKKFDFAHHYYRTKIKQQIAEAPTKEKPLIYNLLGCIKDEESLIHSHNDLFNLMQSVYGDKNLPEQVTTHFNKDATRNILFLGFDFDKWYFQLLLHLLGINYEHCIRYASSEQKPDENLMTLYEAEFKINFVGGNLNAFIGNLHARFMPEQLRKPLEKTAKKNRKYLKGNILKLLAKSFNATDFETFCLINFDSVQGEFTSGQGQSARLNLLIEHAEKHEEYERLLEAAKEENPVQYKNFEPYYEEA